MEFSVHVSGRLLLLSSFAMALTTTARTIDVVSGRDKPPYIISEEDTGFEVELVRKVLASFNEEANFLYVPMGRSVRLINDHTADIALSMSPLHPLPREWLSNTYVTYQNVVVTRKDRNLTIETLSDLKAHTVIAFQTASHALGNDFASMASAHRSYLEIADQRRQVSMLLLGSVDAIVLDINIFESLRRQLIKSADIEVDIHYLFAKSPYHAAIPDATLRARFNKGLDAFKRNGGYAELARKYALVVPASDNPTPLQP